MMIQIAMLSII